MSILRIHSRIFIAALLRCDWVLMIYCEEGCFSSRRWGIQINTRGNKKTHAVIPVEILSDAFLLLTGRRNDTTSYSILSDLVCFHLDKLLIAPLSSGIPYNTTRGLFDCTCDKGLFLKEECYKRHKSYQAIKRWCFQALKWEQECLYMAGYECVQELTEC